ncbi:MAG: class I SAM-dependent methyltransferase [Planctomycetes bacterium]|nr:class I SAM-dependent methyltransferase [Planctomycetota bacterium]
MKLYQLITKYFYSNSDPLAFLPKIRFKKVLDVGCGDGRLTDYLEKHSDELASIDLDPDKINEFKKRFPHLPIIKAGGENVPFPDHYFSLVNCVTVIEHIKNDEQMLKEIFRVLEPNGLAYIVNDAWFYHILRSAGLLMDLPSDTDESFRYPHVNLMRPSQLKKKIKKAGFEIIQSHYSPFFRLKGLRFLLDNRLFSAFATKGHFLCQKPK